MNNEDKANKKNSSPNLTNPINILEDSAETNESFEIPKENEIYLGSTNKISISTNYCTPSSHTPNPSTKKILSHYKFLQKNQKKKVTFKDIEIINIESLKKYNENNYSDKDKCNVCVCMVY